MQLFLGVVLDRHADPIIRVFRNPHRAIKWASLTFRANMAHPEAIVEEHVEGYLWSARCPPEGDHAWVEEATLNEE